MIQKMIGVDTSKFHLDVFISQEAQKRFDNTSDGIEELRNFITEHGGGLVVMEASGGVEKLPFYLLWEMGIECAIVNPRNVRDFAKAMGYLEKTDKLDAKMIAHFAVVKGIVAMPPPSKIQQQLSALSARVRQVIGDIIIQKQRLHTATKDFARNGIIEIIALLKSQEKALSDMIANIIDEDPIWHELDKAFREIKGVANRTIATLLADLPEIGTLSHKAIAKLVGVAPLANDSGKREGKRPIRGGRASVRNILFLVADIARKYDASLNDFRNRLVNAGKPKMAIRIALAHKLLTRLNAKARDARKLLIQHP